MTPSLDPHEVIHFDTAVCPGVSVGICILLRNGQIIYAGEIKNCPDAAGCVLLLNGIDFDLLSRYPQGQVH